MLGSDEGEAVEWVNMCIRKSWRVFQRGLERWFTDLLQPVFDGLLAVRAGAGEGMGVPCGAPSAWRPTCRSQSLTGPRQPRDSCLPLPPPGRTAPCPAWCSGCA